MAETDPTSPDDGTQQAHTPDTVSATSDQTASNPFAQPGPSLHDAAQPRVTPAPPPASPPTTSMPGYGAPPPAYNYQPQPYYNYPPQAPFEGFGIASLVLSIVTLWGLGSVLGIIFGHVALHNIKKYGKRGRGIALAGTIVGYCTLALVLLFVTFAVIFSAYGIHQAGIEHAQIQQDVRAEVSNLNALVQENDDASLQNQTGDHHQSDGTDISVQFLSDDYTDFIVTGHGSENGFSADYVYQYDSATGTYTAYDSPSEGDYNYNDNSTSTGSGSDTNTLNSLYVTQAG